MKRICVEAKNAFCSRPLAYFVVTNAATRNQQKPKSNPNQVVTNEACSCVPAIVVFWYVRHLRGGDLDSGYGSEQTAGVDGEALSGDVGQSGNFQQEEPSTAVSAAEVSVQLAGSTSVC